MKARRYRRNLRAGRVVLPAHSVLPPSRDGSRGRHPRADVRAVDPVGCDRTSGRYGGARSQSSVAQTAMSPLRVERPMSSRGEDARAAARPPAQGLFVVSRAAPAGRGDEERLVDLDESRIALVRRRASTPRRTGDITSSSSRTLRSRAEAKIRRRQCATPPTLAEAAVVVERWTHYVHKT